MVETGSQLSFNRSIWADFFENRLKEARGAGSQLGGYCSCPGKSHGSSASVVVTEVGEAVGFWTLFEG